MYSRHEIQMIQFQIRINFVGLFPLNCLHLYTLETYRDEHKYWSKGTRYFPQKSTNLICSTRLSKKTPKSIYWSNETQILDKRVDDIAIPFIPLHFGLTQWWAVLKYSRNVFGTSCGSNVIFDVRMTRAASSSIDGGCNDISWTNRTTNGFSRNESYSTQRMWNFISIRKMSIERNNSWDYISPTYFD